MSDVRLEKRGPKYTPSVFFVTFFFRKRKKVMEKRGLLFFTNIEEKKTVKKNHRQKNRRSCSCAEPAPRSRTPNDRIFVLRAAAPWERPPAARPRPRPRPLPQEQHRIKRQRCVPILSSLFFPYSSQPPTSSLFLSFLFFFLPFALAPTHISLSLSLFLFQFNR